jgi:sulfur-oxidizing protein SoxY
MTASVSCFPANTHRAFRVVIAALFGLVPVAANADVDPWPEIRKEVIGNRAIDGEAAFALYAPVQAADAALVPVSVRFPADVAAKAKSLTLVIDRNPVPVAAKFIFEDAYRAVDVGERVFSTRVRVDNFSKIRAILETTDGHLQMASQFVAGAGGCSAPASKDPDEALASLGKVQVKTATSDVHDPAWRDVIVMIHHPNFTGMQMDVKTRNFTPARYVDRLEVRAGAKTLFRMEGGISISENPNIRFTYGGPGDERLTVLASDTENAKFSGSDRRGGS